jgi:hypothetical protein
MISQLYPRVLRKTTSGLLKTTRTVSTSSIGPLAVAVSSLRPEVQRLYKHVTGFVMDEKFPVEDEKKTWHIHPKIEELKLS